MERVPKKAPLPCFGLEHNRLDPQCQACPHYDGCRLHMGVRLDKVPLDQVKFDIVPEEFRRENFETEISTDPELPHLQRLYTECYLSVFHLNPTDNVSPYREAIADSANRVNCSVRLYLLSNMVAHTVHEETLVHHTEKQRAASFLAKQLVGKLAEKRATVYQAMCRERYGTFTLSSLAVLTGKDDCETLEATLLRSEVTAAIRYVKLTIFNSAPQIANVYECDELQLAPEWLAIEQTYYDHVLKPFLEKKIKGTAELERHRFSVVQTLRLYKKNLNPQRVVWLTRQRILPLAARRVCAAFNLQPDSFLFDAHFKINPEAEPKQSPMRFWWTLALAIRHHHCWLYVNDEPSYFTPRRNELKLR